MIEKHDNVCQTTDVAYLDCNSFPLFSRAVVFQGLRTSAQTHSIYVAAILSKPDRLVTAAPMHDIPRRDTGEGIFHSRRNMVGSGTAL
jgi:hypothetical protein